MTKGIGNVEYVRQGSEVAVLDQPFWNFLYIASTTKNQKYNVGDRVVTPDGRVFRYGLAGGTVLNDRGAAQHNKVNISALAPAQVADTSTILGVPSAATGAVGSNVITVTVGTSTGGILNDGAVIADAFRGGYIVIGNESAGTVVQNRGIIGNTAKAAGVAGTIQVYLDASLSYVVTPGVSYVEILPNPYSNLQQGDASNLESFLGIPVVYATVGQYFWLQTWGPTWIVPGGAWTSQGVAKERSVYFVGDGSINGTGATGVTVEDGLQLAGFIMEHNTLSSGGPPMVMLQISI
jgi:hypothetical protein